MKSLSKVGAFLEALFNADTRIFPNYEDKRINPPEIASGIRKVLGEIPESAAANPRFADLLEKAKESLDEAKSQTEYQDQKVARLLTIVAFLTAAAGTIFSKVVDAYPIAHAAPWTYWTAIIYAAYVFFFVFVALAGSGALVSFHATRTRFVWDASHGNAVQLDKTPKSQLFFQESIRVSPENWAKSFSDVTPGGENPRLMLESYKGYVIESYLVNAKIADKIRLLEPAQVLLGHAIRALLIWLLFVAVLFVMLGRPAKSEVVPAAVAVPTIHAEDRHPEISPPSTVGMNVDHRGPEIVFNCAPAGKPAPLPPAPNGPSKHRACAARGSETKEPKSRAAP